MSVAEDELCNRALPMTNNPCSYATGRLRSTHGKTSRIIIQQIATLSMHDHEEIVSRRLYMTGILRYTQVTMICPNSCKTPHNHAFSRCKIRFVDILLNNKTIILLNLAEYRQILANSTYGLVG